MCWPTALCFVWAAAGPWTKAWPQIDENYCLWCLIITSVAMFLPSRVRVVYFSNGTCLFMTNGTGAGCLGSAKRVSVCLSSLWWGKRTSWRPTVILLNFLWHLGKESARVKWARVLVAAVIARISFMTTCEKQDVSQHLKGKRINGLSVLRIALHYRCMIL